MANANVVFLPWVRQGAAAGITTDDSLGPAQPSVVSLDAKLTVNAAHGISVPVRLLGPADVTGIDPHQIVRMDPRPGTADFESNNLVGIEFDRPDFPWLFTPARANADAKLRPWLCLVVVRSQDGVRLRPAAEEPLPVLEIASPAVPADELPDLADSWCWAHTQVAHGDAMDLRTVLSGRPELSLSRLLCPRLLAPATDYIVCVVPAFEVGRKAGLGLPIATAELTRLDPAWNLAPAPVTVTLPIYHHWRFRTGAGGDFEKLARLLEARPAPEGVGKRPLDISKPGFTLPADFPAGATVVDVEGALQPMQPAPGAPDWPPGAAGPFRAALADIVNAPGLAQVSAPGSDPLLAPPLYGRWYAARTTVAPAAEQPPWFDELNLDPRHRAVAAFGTQVVQDQQEALMAAAWEQAGDLQRANQRARQMQLGLFVGVSLHARHFARMSDDALLRVSAPAFGRVRAAGSGETVVGQLAGGAVPIKAMSASMRRISRPRGPISRRVNAQGAVSGTVTFISRLNTVGPAAPAGPSSDLVTFNAARQLVRDPSRLRTYQAVTDALIASAPAKPTFQIVPEGQVVPMPFGPAVSRLDSPAARAFRTAAIAHLARVKPGRVGIIRAPRPPISIPTLRSGVFAQIDPVRTITAFALAILPASAPAAAARVERKSTVPLDMLMYIPKFRQPMYEALRDLSQAMLLPGLEAVLPNSVIGLQTNRRFVEAYMVGLNSEMGSELLWRGYPTDLRGTYFDQFWDTRAATDPRPDVSPIDEWRSRTLGHPAGSPAREQFVLLLRGDLLRRYPTAVIYATRAVIIGGVRKPSIEAGDEKLPAFRGSMQPDVFFFGFDLSVNDAAGDSEAGEPGYFIVIQEQPTEPRFGFDDGTDFGGATHVRLAAGAPAGVPLRGLRWGRDAAQMAGITRRQPVRIAIHASQFISKS